MEYRKITIDGVTYNCFTDDELEEMKHQYYLSKEKERIDKDIIGNTISSEQFKKDFKVRYGL